MTINHEYEIDPFMDRATAHPLILYVQIEIQLE